MGSVLRRYGLIMTGWMVATCLFWVVIMILGPLLLMFEFSLRPQLPPRLQGGPDDMLTLRNYAFFFTSDIHTAIFFKTIWSSVIVAFAALVVCYPVAYYLAQVARREQMALLFIGLIVPFWINEILRTFAWLLILARNGVANSVLIGLGITDEPLQLLGQNWSVMLGMVYAYVLFMIFPLYNAMESLDRNQIEAARDLGAPSWRIHWRIVIPHAKPGIAVGCITTFMLAAGSYAVPLLLGGPRSRWFTEVIYAWFFDSFNWNMGAAYAFILLLLCLGFVLAMMKLFRVGLQDIAK